MPALSVGDQAGYITPRMDMSSVRSVIAGIRW